MKKIIVYCEINSETQEFEDTAYELLSKARELKHNAKIMAESDQINDSDYFVEAVGLGGDINVDSVFKALKAGADNVLLLKNEYFNTFIQADIANTFVNYFRQNPSEIIIFPATTKGRIIAPRITTMLDTGLVADCTELEFVVKNNELKLAPTRPTFGAELMATILSRKNPQCATIRPGTFKAEYTEVGSIKDGQFLEYPVKLPPTEQKINIFSSVKEGFSDKIDLSKSKIVFAGGWGICNGKNKEYIEKLMQLSKRLNADFATTRKVVEAGLADKTYQIGQTGSTTNADLYFAFGISGAIQHIQGIKNCKTIIGINSDENAEIFKHCDYKIVEDAKKVIDDMLKILN